MSKAEGTISANEALENALHWAFIELLNEVKKGNQNNENMIIREIKGLHHNTGKNDMPEHLRRALKGVTRSSMGYLNNNGYKVTPIEGK